MNQEATEASFADLFQESSAKALRHLEPGQKITATIVGLAGNSVFLDVSGKNEGILNREELVNKDGEMTATIGDQVEVYFLKSAGGAQIFTIKIGGGKNAAHLEEAWRNGIPVEGLVKEEIKGGFDITLGGSVRAFCPYSQMGIHRVDDAGATYTGRTMTFLITRFEENGRNIVVSARALIEQEREQQKEALQESLAEGATVQGTITSIRDFGAFVDLGGVDGMIPISEIGWSRVEDIKEHLAIGQEVTAVIKKLDWPAGRITLSLKETLQASLVEGATVHGTISSIRDFGAFVDIGGVDGMIPISEIGWSRVEDIKEHLAIGQEVTAVIKKLDWKAGRITLSLKETLPNPWDAVRERFTEGSTHTGTVARLTTFGAFVTLAPGIDGLIHISKLGGGRRINHPREALETGQEVEVKIEGVDNETRKISLAPTDYVSSESKETEEKNEYKQFLAEKTVKKQEDAVGSLGALLQAKLTAQNAR